MSSAAVDQAERAARFRALHDAPGTFVIPNPWDVGTTRILERLGFPALTTTSAGLAFALGRQDARGEVSRAETIEHVRAIAAATSLPVAADLENGFGPSPDHAAETIQLAAAAGAVGGSIEDASGDAAHPIYEPAPALERIQGAVAAARALTFQFVLVARSENFLHGRPDLDDTVKRLVAFAEAGADVLYAPGLPDLEAVRTVCAAVAPKPVNVLAGRGGFTVASLAQAGVRRISIGSALARAGYGAVLAAAREIAGEGTFTFSDSAASFDQLNAFMSRE
ncbi:MAG: isocitrate lyase/phosphoenolpyruvate mutase family protein [Candidatus Eisenbacteria bacterium]